MSVADNYNPTIAIRTNCGIDIGMGHLKRLSVIAEALQKLEYEVIFLLNTTIESSSLPAYFSFPSVTIVPTEPGEINDAKCVIEFMRFHPSLKAVIVDDYTLGRSWEECLTAQGYCVIVIDDILREHHCDLLIDSKWRGVTTQLSYDELIPAGTKKLLGPDYFILSSDYESHVDERLNIHHDKSFSVLISLGGIPDPKHISALVKAFDDFWCIPVTVKLDIVTGSGLKIDQELSNRRVSYRTISDVQSLRPYYMQADLFVGAAGTSMYEAFACRLPAITFAIADNQKIPLQDLHDFGHSNHSNSPPWGWLEGLVRSCEQVYCHYSAVIKHYYSSHHRIDGYGAKRISSEIHQLLSGN